MGMFDNLNEEYNSGNAFAKSAMPEKRALDVLSRLCSREKRKGGRRDYRRLEYLLGNWLPDILTVCELMDAEMLASWHRLPSLASTLVENYRLPMLRDKPLVGVGGPFSAGKSSFLNAITGYKNLLPAEQSPTTAIGTYLIHAADFTIRAHTKSDNIEMLQENELQAITHDFYDTYQIGFADILHKLIITSPKFFEKIILLDTPGYNKDDHNRELEDGDRRTAREHLLNCDYIIWIMSIEAGVINTSDIEFIRDIHIKNPCLFVFNKADKKDTANITNIINDSADVIKYNNIPCFGITAYSSKDRMEFLNKNLIEKFMRLAMNSSALSGMNEINGLQKQWNNMFDKNSQKIDKDINKLKETIINSSNIHHIRSLLENYMEIKHESSKLYFQQKYFDEEMNKFLLKISEYIKADIND